MTEDFAENIMLLAPNVSPMFGHKHRTRVDKFREWLYDLKWHLYALREVLEKDPPSKPGMLALMESNRRKAGKHWYDD